MQTKGRNLYNVAGNHTMISASEICVEFRVQVGQRLGARANTRQN